MADALVGLTLVAMLLGVALNASTQSLRASTAASERRDAAAEAQFRLAAEWPMLQGPGERTGVSASGRLKWRLAATELADIPSPRLCTVEATVEGVQSRRTLTLATTRFCGAPA